MTEKRFILTNPKNIFQKMKCGIDDRGNTLTFNEVVNLLNELHETIQSLISDSEKYRKLSIQFDNRNKELVSENALLEKENEQLKQQLFETSKELLYATSDEVDKVLYYEDEVEELRKEIFK